MHEALCVFVFLVTTLHQSMSRVELFITLYMLTFALQQLQTRKHDPVLDECGSVHIWLPEVRESNFSNLQLPIVMGQPPVGIIQPDLNPADWIWGFWGEGVAQSQVITKGRCWEPETNGNVIS